MKICHYLTLAVTIALWPLSTDAREKVVDKLNIIVIMADDLGYADLSCTGLADDVHTPNIDRLAKKGIRFTNAYVTAPICNASRIAIATGAHQQRQGQYWYGGPGLHDPKYRTIAETLKARGYKTGYVGKFHHGRGDQPDQRGFPLNHGYDTFYGFSGGTKHYLVHNRASAKTHYRGGPMYVQDELQDVEGFTTELFGEKGRAFVREHKDEPFHLFLSFNAVHHYITQLPEAYLKENKLSRIPDFEPNKKSKTNWRKKFDYPNHPDGRKYYLGHLYYMDREIGLLLDELETLGIAEKTVVIFLGDNGGGLALYANNGIFKGGKYTNFEGGLRVPMIISHPNIQAPDTASGAMVSSLDILPTVCAMTGTEIPANVDGINLSPMLKGESLDLDRRILYWDTEIQKAVRRGKWKLLITERNPAGDVQKVETPTGTFLFNLEEDPGESNDLSAEYPEIAQELLGKLKAWQEEVKKSQLSEESQETASKKVVEKAVATTPVSGIDTGLKPKTGVVTVGTERCTGSPFKITAIPEELKGARFWSVARGDKEKPGKGYEVTVDKAGTAYLFVFKRGELSGLEGWTQTNLAVQWVHGSYKATDAVYSKSVSAGEKIVVPSHTGKKGATYGIPHMLLLSDQKVVNNTGRPNVLFIAVDDLNDWVGYLKGHPQAKTPNIDKLAGESLAFTRAYCSASSCGPSRTSLMYGIYPHRSGAYFHHYEYSPEKRIPRERVPLQLAFQQNGYYTTGSGKIYHGGRGYFDTRGWDHYDKTPFAHKAKITCVFGEKAERPLSDFRIGVTEQDPDSDVMDGGSVNWAIKQLSTQHNKPFFLAVGLRKPHAPWVAPREFYAQYDGVKIQLPEVPTNDLDDIPDAGKFIAHSVYPFFKTREHEVIAAIEGMWEKLVLAYLATCSYADYNVGRILKALEESPYANNTIVVLWGDHGWHLGEKEHWRKMTLWEQGTRVPFIIKMPGMTEGKRVDAPVSLQDIYPTLVDLCGLNLSQELDGNSLTPLLNKKDVEWDKPALINWGPGNFAVRQEQWKLIRYADGSEEFYDISKDPNEYTNLADHPEFQPALEKLRTSIPKTWKYIICPRTKPFEHTLSKP